MKVKVNEGRNPTIGGVGWQYALPIHIQGTAASAPDPDLEPTYSAAVESPELQQISFLLAIRDFAKFLQKAAKECGLNLPSSVAELQGNLDTNHRTIYAFE